jgi:phospho-N-acetylmuramoyl-pentapeptide-transferase
MGGIYFVPVGLAVALVLTHAAPVVVAAASITLASGAIGWLDDWQVIRAHSNKGISPKLKLILQLLLAIAVCGGLVLTGTADTAIALPLLSSLPLGLLFWPLAVFALVGSHNAVNLTDGLDGLAASTVAIALVSLGVVVGDPQLALLAFALTGSCLGFLAHNRHPAQVFMGDTGALALGGALAAIALLGNLLWALAIAGGVFVAEALSVMLQVSYFKYTKRRTGNGQRLFRMSPLHHHLELGGWSETTVVMVLCAVSATLGASAWLLHLL